MRKSILVIASLCLSLGAFAQTSEFTPGWYAGIKGGVGYTVGEYSSFSKFLSPSAALNLGYQFTPVFGLRGDLSGLQGKGSVGEGKEYTFNYGQLGLDATFDLCNLFSGYKARTVNPYVFAGVAGNLRFNNDQAQDLKANFAADNYLWEDPTVSVAGRAGIGIDFRLSDCVAITAEIATNLLTDHFNSKNGGSASVFDHQYQALIGLKFNLGKKAAAPAPAPAPVAQPEPVKQVAEPAPAPVAEPEPEPVVEEAAKPAINLTENVFFVINKWDIRPAELAKIEEIVKVLNENPETNVTITGYADKATGTASRNMFLSQKRAEVVTNKLVELGIAKDRISSAYKGSEENPYPTPEENRVAICVVK